MAIGALNVSVTASVGNVLSGLQKVRRTLRNLGRSVTDFAFSAKGLTTALAGGAFVKFTADAYRSIDALAKSADKLGVTTQALAGLNLAADEAGVSQQLLETSLVRMVRGIERSSVGLGGLVDTYQELGLNVHTLRRMSPDEQFVAIADAIGRLSDKNVQLKATTDIFGARAGSLVALMRGGRSAFDEAAQAADNLGLAVDRVSAAGVERAIDSFGRLRTAVGGIFRSIAIETAPFIEALTSSLTSLLTHGGRAKSIGSAIGGAVVQMSRFVIDSVAKMSAGVLRTMSALVSIPNSLASTTAGVAMGFEYSQTLADVAAGMRTTAWQLTGPRGPAAMIDGAIAKAKQAASEQVKPESHSLSEVVGWASAAGRSTVQEIFAQLAGARGVIGSIAGSAANIVGHNIGRNRRRREGPSAAEIRPRRETGFGVRADTTEGWRLLRSSLQGGGGDVPKKQLETNKQQLAEQRRAAAQLGRLVELVKAGGSALSTFTMGGA